MAPAGSEPRLEDPLACCITPAVAACAATPLPPGGLVLAGALFGADGAGGCGRGAGAGLRSFSGPGSAIAARCCKRRSAVATSGSGHLAGVRVDANVHVDLTGAA